MTGTRLPQVGDPAGSGRGAAASGSRRAAFNEERLLTCVHCGFCLPACPTYRRLGDEADSPRGRLHLMRAVAEDRLSPASDAFQLHIDRCLGCRACETACPSGVEYGLLLEEARAVAVEARSPGWGTRLLPRIFATPLLRGPLLLGGRILRDTGIAGKLARRAGRGKRGDAMAERLGYAMGMLAGSASSERLRHGGGGVGGEKGGARTGVVGGLRGVRIGVLRGCVQAGLFGRVGEATRRVLRVNGASVVEVPGEGCCGALHAHSGDRAGAARLARANIEAFERAGVEWIVVDAAGCGAAMREYGELLADDGEWAERASAFARRVRDVSEALTPEALRGAQLERGAPLPVRVAYDAPCHLLHAQGVDDAPRALLRGIEGVELVPLRGSAECCGGAGIYGLTHPELGGRIGGDKVDAVRESGAELLATGNPGCMMQIGGGLHREGVPVEVVHPVEILDESYRRGGRYRANPEPVGRVEGRE